ncbi:hypothetical protein ARMGADRAFT_295224 [Armillaria gallica]|uniref:Uncharacterized protein n=1 Tax=Armillaria gallica TaxID=47427 RepID=A0A2H3DHB3_ARMGA|nr:hypothetical protein ARMGADRAFT_295224 [Armillaria gallica]
MHNTALITSNGCTPFHDTLDSMPKHRPLTPQSYIADYLMISGCITLQRATSHRLPLLCVTERYGFRGLSISASIGTSAHLKYRTRIDIWWEYASQCYIQGSHLEQRARSLDACVHSPALDRTYFPSMTPLVHSRVDSRPASALYRAKTLSSTAGVFLPGCGTYLITSSTTAHVDGPTYLGTR